MERAHRAPDAGHGVHLALVRAGAHLHLPPHRVQREGHRGCQQPGSRPQSQVVHWQRPAIPLRLSDISSWAVRGHAGRMPMLCQGTGLLRLRVSATVESCWSICQHREPQKLSKYQTKNNHAPVCRAVLRCQDAAGTWHPRQIQRASEGRRMQSSGRHTAQCRSARA